MRFRIVFACLSAVLLLVGATEAGHAATITQVIPYSGIPNYTQTLTFDQFDDLAGTLTLTGIEVTVDFNAAGGQLILDNDAAGPAAGTFEFGAKASLSSPDVVLLDGASQPVVGNLSAFHTQVFALDANVGDVSNDFDPSAPDGLAYNGIAQNDFGSGFVTAHFGAYTGAGTYDVNVGASQWQDFGGISGIEWAVNPVTTNGAVTVVYTYVPEPATLSLLAFGGLGMWIRRKRNPATTA